MTRFYNLLDRKTQKDSVSDAVRTTKKVRNIVTASVTSAMLVGFSPLQVAFAEGISEAEPVVAEENITIVTNEGAEEPTENGGAVLNTPLVNINALATGLFTEAVPFATPAGGSYNPDDHWFLLVSEETSSEHWGATDGHTTKLTDHYNTAANAKVVKDGQLIDVTINCTEHSNVYSFEVFDGTSISIITIDYSNFNNIVLNVTDDIAFTLRWQDNDGHYHYYKVSGAGNYVIPNANNIIDLWFGVGKDQLPPPPVEYCEIEGKTHLPKNHEDCQTTPVRYCTVIGKENLPIDDPACFEETIIEKCEVPGKEDLEKGDPKCKEDLDIPEAGIYVNTKGSAFDAMLLPLALMGAGALTVTGVRAFAKK